MENKEYLNKIIQHDVTKKFPLPNNCIDVCITSPPYWGLRDYGVDGQIGLEKHPNEYIGHMVQVAREVKRVLKKSGSFYLNLGDTYCGSGMGTWNVPDNYKSKQVYFMGKGKAVSAKVKNDGGWLQPKQLMLIPVRVAIALQDDGWVLRNDIIWHKPNPMPSSVKDRLNNTFEHVFHFVKSRRYYYDLDSIREPHKTEFRPTRPITSHGKEPNPSGGSNNLTYNKMNPEGKNPGYVFNNKASELKQVMYGEDKIGRSRLRAGLDTKTNEEKQHPYGKNPGDFWNICTQPFTSYNPDMEHFAVFPEELIVKPIKSSCPKEICKKCGKPRTRITKTNTTYESGSGKSGRRPKGKYKDKDGTGIIGKNLRMGPTPHVETIGWSDCGCNAGFNSGVVLDPFGGRGTVGRVAKRLGLNYVIFDIKPEYCELARLYIDGQKTKLIKHQKKLKI